MSTARKPNPPAPPSRPDETPVDVARMNAALKASGIDYQVEGEVDAAAFTRAFAKRFKKTMAKLAE